MSKWTRRSLFFGAAALGGPFLAFGAGALWCRIKVMQRSKLSGLSPLMTVYPDAGAAKALGKQYLQQVGANAHSCLARLEAAVRIRRAAGTGCHTETLLVMKQACCDDFREGRIHCVDGWVLAQTELDVAALFTIE